MNKISKYISFLLRHEPEHLNLNMDKYGYVNVEELIRNINNEGIYCINKEILDEIVYTDKKGRYKYNSDQSCIKANQGHSLDFIEVELDYKVPPEFLYHGTTLEAYEMIKKSGYISRMERHHVHLSEDIDIALMSAKRWNKKKAILKINALKLYNDGYIIGVTDNHVWCVK